MKFFIVLSVSQWPNLRHLCDWPGGTEGLLETVGLRRPRKVCDDEQVPMLEEVTFKLFWSAVVVGP